MLTNDEKIAIVNSHKKSLYYAQYGVLINLLEENSKSSPVAASVQSLNNQIEDYNKQIAALDAEIASLS
jgi:hypothetical protein